MYYAITNPGETYFISKNILHRLRFTILHELLILVYLRRTKWLNYLCYQMQHNEKALAAETRAIRCTKYYSQSAVALARLERRYTTACKIFGFKAAYMIKKTVGGMRNSIRKQCFGNARHKQLSPIAAEAMHPSKTVFMQIISK